MSTFKVYPINEINIVEAKGSTLVDDQGTKYLDMYGGHAVISIGHSAPTYKNYLTDQLNKIGFYSNSIQIPLQEELATKLAEISGKPDYSLFMCNSGAEANENAIKLASFHNGKSRIISFTDSFHGRTSMAVAATDLISMRAKVNDTDNVTFVEYNNIQQLKDVFEKHDDISCVIIEAIQGVGGVATATTEFIQTIRELCDKNEVVMIADCVQCGCGRTGKYFALDHSGVNADIYSMAKGIGNGFPVGAILISPIFEAKYGMLGTTFGGNHLACAAALAVVDDMNSKELMKAAEEMGDYLISRLKELDSPRIVEIRGRGLMIGIKMDIAVGEIRNKLLFEDKIFVGNASDNTILRVLPSLTITKEDCDQFINALKKYL